MFNVGWQTSVSGIPRKTRARVGLQFKVHLTDCWTEKENRFHTAALVRGSFSVVPPAYHLRPVSNTTHNSLSPSLCRSLMYRHRI